VFGRLADAELGVALDRPGLAELALRVAAGTAPSV
jgi:hypothetical protein